jgi:hypothetical protein
MTKMYAPMTLGEAKDIAQHPGDFASRAILYARRKIYNAKSLAPAEIDNLTTKLELEMEIRQRARAAA